MKGVYILHFSEPYKHARHYTGFSYNVPKRIRQHLAGNGARLLQVIREHNIGFVVGSFFENQDWTFERILKNRRNPAFYCFVCRTKKRLEKQMRKLNHDS